MCTRAFLDKKRSQILCVDRNFSCFERNEKKVVDPLIIIISYLYISKTLEMSSLRHSCNAVYQVQNARHNNSVSLDWERCPTPTEHWHHIINVYYPIRVGPKIFELVGLIYNFNGYICVIIGSSVHIKKGDY